MESYLFRFQMMYKFKFRKIDPYDWFCGPGSHTVYSKHENCLQINIIVLGRERSQFKK